ncbi:MAG: hypothetical protein JRE64_03040 [Deltaproteobacteria bacterium]|nr:hypothetical protein [Deltaproteobacteria bacterium]
MEEARLCEANKLPEDFFAEFEAEHAVKFTRLCVVCFLWRKARENR